jgi:hypothetical protein
MEKGKGHNDALGTLLRQTADWATALIFSVLWSYVEEIVGSDNYVYRR